MEGIRGSIFTIRFWLFTAFGLFILLGYIIVRNYEPPPPYYYPEEDVVAVCRLFQLDNTDNFCGDTARQTPLRLNAMLQRYFPVRAARHEHIIPYIKSLEVPIQPETCLEHRINWPPGYCPPPDECDIPLSVSNAYTCYVEFPGDIGVVSIGISKSTGEILRYGVSISAEAASGSS